MPPFRAALVGIDALWLRNAVHLERRREPTLWRPQHAAVAIVVRAQAAKVVAAGEDEFGAVGARLADAGEAHAASSSSAATMEISAATSMGRCADQNALMP